MIRRAETAKDFEACAEIYAEVMPDGRLTAAQAARSPGTTLLHGDEGFAFVKASSIPGSAFAMVRVRPSVRRRGVGSVLLEAAREEARSLACLTVWGRVHEPDTGSLRFAEARGLAEAGRDVEVLLTVTPCAWPEGVVELRDVHLAGAYEVVVEATPEMALPMIAAAPPFDEWIEKERQMLAAAFVALDGDEVVGYAALFATGTSRLENGLTAVKKSHRRRGLALALKRAQIAWAAENGFTEIITDMVEGNAAMRAVNEQLGYVERPAWIVVEGPA
jgi:GNAT superfamily N-acetyltransferase